MARGQRFELNLDSDSDDNEPHPLGQAANFNLVKDVLERDVPTTTTPPAPPKSRGSSTGFPAPKVRKAPSRFKKQTSTSTQALPEQEPVLPRDEPAQPRQNIATKQSTPYSADVPSEERARIDRENKEILARMSDAEIERERQELLAGGVPGLTPSLIERLLRRANISDGSNEETANESPSSNQTRGGRLDANSGETVSSIHGAEPRSVTGPRRAARKVTFATPASPMQAEDEEQSKDVGTAQPGSNSTASLRPKPRSAHDPEAPPAHPPPDLHPVSSKTSPPKPTIQDLTSLNSATTLTPPRQLDPASPSFLSDLHSTYYPNLPADPSKLSWLQPLPSDPPSTSSYNPSQSSLPPSSLRFDFRGQILPPSLSAQLPVSLGLHHHADAPESAGYTISELATLQRSLVVAQRCVAIQTLGRVLYRLGKGEFGGEGSELAEGLWAVIGRERVVESLVAEAGGGLGEAKDRSRPGPESGEQNPDANTKGSEARTGPRQGSSRTAWALATEAVWLWQRSGGRAGTEYQTR
jgi:RNA polymerase II-associated protein 1